MNTYSQHQIHYSNIQKSFEKALRSYDDEAVVQRQAGNCLIDHLSQIKAPHQQILDLGCGTGLVTRDLCERFPSASLHINDFSPLLLKVAYDRLKTFHVNPLLFNFDQRWKCYSLYDLIFSNMAFQWSFDIYELLRRCYNHLNKNGILAFSLPLMGSCFELNPQQRIPLLTFDDVYQALTKVGFIFLHTDTVLRCQEFRTHREALKSIKRCGANYVPRNKGSTVLDRSKLFLPSTLNYKIGIFIASKRSS